MVPEPARNLGPHGRALWNDVWQRGDIGGTVEQFLILCEQLDERVVLRTQIVLSCVTVTKPDGSTSEVVLEPYQLVQYRNNLRSLEEQILRGMEALGLQASLPQATTQGDNWVKALAEGRVDE